MTTTKRPVGPDGVAEALARGAKMRRVEGLPLIRIYWARMPYYLTADGRYEIHGGPEYRTGWDNSQADYWVIDATTGERINDYVWPADSYLVSDGRGNITTQYIPERVGVLATMGFKNVVRRLRDYMAAKEAAA